MRIFPPLLSFRGILAMALMLFGSLGGNLKAQCDLTLYYENADATGNTVFTYHLGPGECEANVSLYLDIVPIAITDPAGCTAHNTIIIVS